MSTRRLILLALACGLAILVAGSIQLLRISRSDNTVSVGEPGDTKEVDGVAVTVLDGSDADEVVVRLEVDTGRDPLLNAAALFSVKVADARFMPTATAVVAEAPPCSELRVVDPGTSAECSMSFDPTGEGSRYLQFVLRGKTGVWLLP